MCYNGIQIPGPGHMRTASNSVISLYIICAVYIKQFPLIVCRLNYKTYQLNYRSINNLTLPIETCLRRHRIVAISGEHIFDLLEYVSAITSSSQSATNKNAGLT